MTPSIGARAFTGLLRLADRRRIYQSPEALHRSLAQVRRSGPAQPSRALQQQLQVRCEQHDGHTLWRLRPRAAVAPGRVLYLHGGAYVRPITGFHWRLLGELVARTGREHVVPLYPLAPEHHGLAALRWVRAVHDAERARSDEPLLLMGDSAGGGLALALAADLAAAAAPPPRRLILITPWVDVEIPHPDAASLAASDPMLALGGAREAGRLYAGGLPTAHPAISPARSPEAQAGHGAPLTIYLGSRDLLTPDTLALAERLHQCGVSVDLRMGQGLMHVWPLLPFREARQARREIAALIAHSLGG